MAVRKVAIFGGGPAGLATAFELTSHPGWQERFDITIYQLGWRLGGKCASGCNREREDRIEEHGLHVLYGWYENVFRMMRACYDELGRPAAAPLATWDEAVEPLRRVYVPEYRHDAWHFDPLVMPDNDLAPGENDSLTPWALVLRLLNLAEAGLGTVRQRSTGGAKRVPRGPLTRGPLAMLRSRLTGAPGGGRFTRLLGKSADTPLALVKLAVGYARTLPMEPSQHRSTDHQALAQLIDRALDTLRRSRAVVHHRRAMAVSDLALAIARGLLADRLLGPPIDFLRIDEEDFREWLLRHGAAPETVHSPLLSALYAAAFATHVPRIGAGTLLHATLRMLLTYKGSFQFWLRAGMGETLIAPLYLVLRRRGVRFRFFHSVNRIELSADRRRVARVIVDRQATVRQGDYQPLIDVKGLPCWPTEPLYDQLVEGDALRTSGENLEDWWTQWPNPGQVVLEDGKDFDSAVLAMSVGALPYTCQELIADPDNPRFGQMVRNLATTSTQALQLWLNPKSSRLGWPVQSRPILIPFAEPFDTWADMSHLLDRERWPAYRSPGSLHYFCAAQTDAEPLPPRSESGYHGRQLARVREEALRWLRDSAPALFPGAAGLDAAGAFNFQALADPEERHGEQRLAAQHFATPANPSDRYVLSVPGSSRYRLRADESGYQNLILAGDWIKTSLSVGCLEAAVMSGHNAAQALWPGARRALWDWLFPSANSSVSASASPPSASSRPAPITQQPGGLPPLRRFDGSLVVPAPVGLAIRVFTFVLAAEPQALQALCDRYLNLGGPVYRPLGPFVILYCASVDNHPEVERIGWCPELDFGFWVPLEAGTIQGGRFRAERQVTFTPYIWVDNAPALLGGREVFGFAKQLGRLTLPGWDAAPEHFAVDTLVLPKYAPEAVPVEARVLEIRRRSGAAGSGSPSRLVQSAVSLHQSLRGLSASGTALSRPFGRFLVGSARGMRMVFLKQLPDATDGTRACYQALIEGELPIRGRPQLSALPGDFEVTVRSFDSLQVAEQLGLRGTRGPDGALRCIPLVQGKAAFESRAERGIVVHRTV